MAVIESGGVNHAAQAENSALQPEMEADSLFKIRFDLENEAADLDSLEGLLSLLGQGETARGEADRASAFYSVMNYVQCRKDSLNDLVGRIMAFESQNASATEVRS